MSRCKNVQCSSPTSVNATCKGRGGPFCADCCPGCLLKTHPLSLEEKKSIFDKMSQEEKITLFGDMMLEADSLSRQVDGASGVGGRSGQPSQPLQSSQPAPAQLAQPAQPGFPPQSAQSDPSPSSSSSHAFGGLSAFGRGNSGPGAQSNDMVGALRTFSNWAAGRGRGSSAGQVCGGGALGAGLGSISVGRGSVFGGGALGAGLGSTSVGRGSVYGGGGVFGDAGQVFGGDGLGAGLGSTAVGRGSVFGGAGGFGGVFGPPQGFPLPPAAPYGGAIPPAAPQGGVPAQDMGAALGPVFDFGVSPSVFTCRASHQDLQEWERGMILDAQQKGSFSNVVRYATWSWKSWEQQAVFLAFMLDALVGNGVPLTHKGVGLGVRRLAALLAVDKFKDPALFQVFLPEVGDVGFLSPAGLYQMHVRQSYAHKAESFGAAASRGRGRGGRGRGGRGRGGSPP